MTTGQFFALVTAGFTNTFDNDCEKHYQTRNFLTLIYGKINTIIYICSFFIHKAQEYEGFKQNSA